MVCDQFQPNPFKKHVCKNCQGARYDPLTFSFLLISSFLLLFLFFFSFFLFFSHNDFAFFRDEHGAFQAISNKVKDEQKEEERLARLKREAEERKEREKKVNHSFYFFFSIFLPLLIP